MKKLVIAATAVVALGTQQASATTAKEYAWIDKSEKYVASVLKDPDSAKFSNSRFYRGSGAIVVCGKVNARNGFGGYTGYKRFITNGLNILAFEKDIRDFDNAWRMMCK